MTSTMYDDITRELNTVAITLTATELAREGKPVTDQLLNAATKVVNKKRELRQLTEDLADRMAQVLTRLETGSLPNSLGELQSAGPRHDLLCAELAAAMEHLQVIAGIWKTIN